MKKETFEITFWQFSSTEDTRWKLQSKENVNYTQGINNSEQLTK